MDEKRPLPKELQEKFAVMRQNFGPAQDHVKEMMGLCLNNPYYWAGGRGRIKKQQFLRRIGLDPRGNASATAQLWRELVAIKLLPTSCDYRLCFALEALGYDPQTWLKNHQAWAPKSVSRIAQEVNSLLEERGYGEISIGWYEVKKAIDHLHSLPTPTN